MTTVFDPSSLTGNKSINDVIEHDLKHKAKKLDLGFGLDRNNIKGVAGFQLFSSGVVPTNIPLRNARTSYLFNNNGKVFKDIERELGVKERSTQKPVLNTHKILFTNEPTKEHGLKTEDRTHLRGLTSKYFGIPSQPDIKLETAAVNEVHLNTRNGHFEPVSAKQFQAANARSEYEDGIETVLQAVKEGKKQDDLFDNMEKGTKRKTKIPSDKSVDEMEKGKSTKVLTRTPAPPVVRPVINQPQAGGGPDPKKINFH